jgi:uncharacterized protein YhhL (DUF1145 family)
MAVKRFIGVFWLVILLNLVDGYEDGATSASETLVTT